MKKKSIKNHSIFGQKVVLIPAALLIALLSFVGGSQYEKRVQTLPEQYNDSTTTDQHLLTKQTFKRVIDGDTIEIANGQIVRYVGITASEAGKPFEDEATEENKKLVKGKKVTLEYDSENYRSDKFGRILFYVIVGKKNLSIELARKGLARVVIYEKRKPWKYQAELLNAQNEARRYKRGIWSLPK